MALVSFQVDYGDQTSISSASFIQQEIFEDVGSDELEEGKIMSPELALQRERAYARKVANLHNEANDSPVSIQELPLSPILDRASPPDNLSNLLPQPSHLRQTYVEQTLQTQPSDNPPHFPSPELQKAKRTLQIQSSNRPLVQPPNLQSQSSESLRVIPSPHLQKGVQTLQIPSSQNPPHLPLPRSQLQTSKQNFQIQSSRSLPYVLPPLLQTPKQTLPNQTGTLPFVCTSQLQQPCSRQIIQTQSSESLSTISQPQMQQSYTAETVKFQSLENPSRNAPIQMRNLYANRKSQIQPFSLVCKECLVVCSSTSTLKQHYKGRKHRTRVQELRMQRNIIQSSANQSVAIEPLWCDVCRIRCMNEDCFLQHLKGKKHADCVQAINAAKELRRDVGESSSSQRQGRFGVGSNFH